MVIRKIFSGIFDEEIHSDFLKFGKGEFKNKYLLERKKQKDKWAIKTGSEFVNFLVKKFLCKIEGEVFISGVIVSTTDLTKEMSFQIKKKSNFQGVRKFQIETNADSKKILDLMEKYPRVFFALSFRGDDFELKIKPKSPKSGKPGKESGEGPKADFCSVKTNDSDVINELFFDCAGFDDVKISHTIKIEEIVYPQNIGVLKPEEIREQSKRKGKVIRKIFADGKEEIRESEFVV